MVISFGMQGVLVLVNEGLGTEFGRNLRCNIAHENVETRDIQSPRQFILHQKIKYNTELLWVLENFLAGFLVGQFVNS